MNDFAEAIKAFIRSIRSGPYVVPIDVIDKCKKCFHYKFTHPNEVEWDHYYIPVGHVCEYSCCSKDPYRNCLLDGDNSFWSKEKTIEKRIEDGQCEFAEFPKARSKNWNEKDKKWDSKYRRKMAELLGKEWRSEGHSEEEIQEMVEDESDWKNYYRWPINSIRTKTYFFIRSLFSNS